MLGEFIKKQKTSERASKRERDEKLSLKAIEAVCALVGF